MRIAPAPWTLGLLFCSTGLAFPRVSCAQVVVNGGFDNGTTGWTIHNPDDEHEFVYLENFDIDGPGPQPTSLAPGFEAGSYFLHGIDLSQDVSLMGGQLYHFSADTASSLWFQQYGYNVEGGQIFVTLGNTSLVSYNFGGIYAGTSLYKSLETDFQVSTTGTYHLNINFYRNYGASPRLTPIEYIDNISIAGVPVPEVDGRVLGASLLTLGGGLFYRRRHPRPSRASLAE